MFFFSIYKKLNNKVIETPIYNRYNRVLDV